jgi:serine/threonine protein phosphatase PrpC
MGAVTMLVAAKSDVGRKRKTNQDAFKVLDLASGSALEAAATGAEIEVQDAGVLLALSDGMGGHEAGEVASAMVVESVCSAIQAASGDAFDKRLEAAVHRANADVASAARAANKKGMGATLTAVFATGADAYVAVVGDSRAYLLRQGKFRQITRDQSLVQALVEGGLLSPEQAKRSPRKNVILQAMGLADDVQVAIARLGLHRGDTILVCCDGLSNAISDDELAMILIASDPAIACQKLIDLANERGGEDNLTAIVARFGGEGLAPAFAGGSVSGTFEVLKEFKPEVPTVPPPPANPVKSSRPPAGPEARRSARPSARPPARASAGGARLAVGVLVAVVLIGLAALAYWWTRHHSILHLVERARGAVRG